MVLCFDGDIHNIFNMGKIIIQSVFDDRTSKDVCRWIEYYGHIDRTIPVNDVYEVHSFKLLISTSEIEIGLNKHTIDENDVFWYRRGVFKMKNIAESKSSNVNSYIREKQIIPVSNFLGSLIFKNQINCFRDNSIDKMIVLTKCKQLGIRIPATLVTNTKAELMHFLTKHEKIITKSIVSPSGNVVINGINYTFSAPTVLLTDSDIKNIPQQFAPSLFQEYVTKKYEIRSFFFNEKLFSMAIFSQKNKKTQVDFRNYDHICPNRNVPFKIPTWYEKKLLSLYKQLNLKSGSADIIVTPDDQFVFLEINPIGQFGWLSKNCNYYLEKLVSKHLIQ